MHLTETAFAKINLALHVRQRREDGYHDIETIFAFVDDGDRLTAHAAEADRLSLTGEFAGALGDPFGNIVAKALTLLPRGSGWHVTLDKRLPVAAGLGGGSADAGALFRLVDAAEGLPDDWHARAARLGADVPACVAGITAVGLGTGTELTPLADDLAGTPVLLVNPRVAMPTGPVFAGWDGIDRGPLPTGGPLRDRACAARNDLEPSARADAPQIGEALDLLSGTSAWLVRMSGSGATCFALYDSAGERDAADAALAAERPGWWRMTGALR